MIKFSAMMWNLGRGVIAEVGEMAIHLVAWALFFVACIASMIMVLIKSSEE